MRGIGGRFCWPMWLMWFCFGLLYWTQTAATEIPLQGQQGHYVIGNQVDYLEDPGGLLDLEAVRASRSFTRVKSEVPNFGFTQSTYWLRINMRNIDAGQSEWLLENQFALIDYYDAHLIYPNRPIVSYQSGDMRPFAQRGIKHRNIIFAVHLAAGESVEVYLRAASSGSVQAPLVLWSATEFATKNHDEQFILGIYYGTLVAMFLYNLMLYLSTRDRGYLYYLLYLGNYLLFQMALNGLAFEYLWPESPRWGNVSLPVLFFLSVMGVFQFARTFLQLQSNLPRLDMICKGFLAFYALMVPLNLILPYAIMIRFAALSGVTGPIFIFVCGLSSLRLGTRQAKYFLLAWAAFLLGCSTFGLLVFGLIPNIFLTEHGLQIGSAIEVVLLSFALADRMRILKEENERIMREATEMLEQNVQIRTVKLEQANLELEDALNSLKMMQNELIRAEKMAALGSLVGGVAHELNTPIGNSITMGSALLDETKKMMGKIKAGAVRLATIESHLRDMDEGIEVLLRNLQRAAELVSGFKQVAVDRSTDRIRRFDLKHTLEEIVLTLGPMLRNTPYRITLDLAKDITIESYPGPLGQIITNFISNAVTHGFDGKDQGCIRLATRRCEDDQIEIVFSDDGNGMDEIHLRRVFEPFFTTKLGQGGSGLGMHIVYNLVTEVLRGKIDVESRIGAGTTLRLRLPSQIPVLAG